MKNYPYILVVALIIIGVVGYKVYRNSPEQKFARMYEAGLLASSERDISVAIDLFEQLIAGNTIYAEQSKTALLNLNSREFLKQISAEDVVLTFRAASPFITDTVGFLYEAEVFVAENQMDNPIPAAELAQLISEETEESSQKDGFSKKAHALFLANLDQVKSDKKLAYNFVTLDEREAACENCESVLTNFVGELGDSEAARSLGQYYSYSGELDKAYPLLSTYVDTHLPHYKKVDKAYKAYWKKTDDIWDQVVQDVNDRKMSKTFYEVFDAADEDRQEELKNDEYSERIHRADLNESVLTEHTKAAKVVSVALELGIVILRRATSLNDPKQRRDALSEAESIFLSIRDDAGSSDQYQLYLGQVYYWLGKPDEGDALFNALIDKYERAPGVLASITDVMRDLGASQKALEYIEEAYSTADSDEEKGRYAYTRYLLTVDIDERIKWLERSPKSEAFVQGELFATKAEQAVRKGETQKADELYAQAIKKYLTTTNQEQIYNNLSLILMSKYDNGGDVKDYDQALEYMDKAVKAFADDAIVLFNAAEQFSVRLYRDVLSEKMDFDVIGGRANLKLFSFLYDNDSEKQRIIEEILKHPSSVKTFDYLDRAVLMSPKSWRTFIMAYSSYRFIRNNEKIVDLSKRLDAVSLEMGVNQGDIDSYRNGDLDQEGISSVKQSIKEYQKTLSGVDRNKQAFEYIVLSTYANNVELSILDYGQLPELKKVLASAEENYQRLSSSATRSAYIRALFADVTQELKSLDTEFKRFHEKYYRVFDSDDLIAIAIHGLQGVREKALKIESMNKVIELKKISAENFSGFPKTYDWYFFSGVNDEFALKVSKRLKVDKMQDHFNKIAEHSAPSLEQKTLRKYYTLAFEGKTAEAKSLVESAIAAGQLMPELLLN